LEGEIISKDIKGYPICGLGAQVPNCTTAPGSAPSPEQKPEKAAAVPEKAAAVPEKAAAVPAKAEAPKKKWWEFWK